MKKYKGLRTKAFDIMCIPEKRIPAGRLCDPAVGVVGWDADVCDGINCGAIGGSCDASPRPGRTGE